MPRCRWCRELRPSRCQPVFAAQPAAENSCCCFAPRPPPAHCLAAAPELPFSLTSLPDYREDRRRQRNLTRGCSMFQSAGPPPATPLPEARARIRNPTQNAGTAFSKFASPPPARNINCLTGFCFSQPVISRVPRKRLWCFGRGNGVKTPRRLFDCVEDFKQTVHSHQLENRDGCRRNRRQFYVSIAFHRFFNAMQKNLYSRTVNVLQLGAIQNNARTIGLKQRLYLLKKCLALKVVES